MPNYLAPGVYVEEVPSAVQPIAGVGTSTAGFIGFFGGSISTPTRQVTGEPIGVGDGSTQTFKLKDPVKVKAGSLKILVGGNAETAVTFAADPVTRTTSVTFTSAPVSGLKITADYEVDGFYPVAASEVKLCTTFGEFKKFFGPFSLDAGQKTLAHAVYGFFNNGGTRCFVVRQSGAGDVTRALEKFEAIDEIALVAVPGSTDANVRSQLAIHCRQKTGDRFAILDCHQTVETGGILDLTKLDASTASHLLPGNSDYSAFYFPWIEVYDPVTGGPIHVPPSGHVAGVYARVDTNRGVHKAPANEPVLGALGLKYPISRAQQKGLNPQGVNCIRDLNGNINVWGARTAGGDANGEWKYVNVRRLFLFLRESIDEGTQWVVFEPNEPGLWAKISRNVTAFLTNVWRSGALFGSSPQEAFYVKCDAETNPPEVREDGRVETEIGVAVVKPAEFVIFKISQWAGAGG